MSADLRAIRTKLYLLAQGKPAEAFTSHEAWAILQTMGRKRGVLFIECDDCGAPVRSPAALAEDGVEGGCVAEEALNDHADDCTWVTTIRRARAK